MDATFFKLGKTTFGSQKSDGDLLTAYVEEDAYDALNNETFGDAGFDGEDWEESHEKLAELINPAKASPLLNYDILDDDIDHIENGSKEIIQQSLSQLGLEDDLEDTAIRSYGRSNQRPFHSAFGHSPPPPAIIDSEECGSPKTRTIWTASLPPATPPQNNDLGSLLKSLQSPKIINSSYHVPPVAQPHLFGTPESLRTSSIPITAQRLEDIERDMLQPNNVWPNTARAMHAENLEKVLLGLEKPAVDKWEQNDSMKKAWNQAESSPMPIRGQVRTLDEVEKDILQQQNSTDMANQLERFLQNNEGLTSRPPPGFTGSPGIPTPNRVPQPPIGTPPNSSMFSHLTGSPMSTSPVSISHSMQNLIGSPLRPQMSPVVTHHPQMNVQRMGAPFPHPPNRNFQGPPPPLHPQQREYLAQADLRRLLYQRQIHHPFLNKQWIPQLPNQLPPNWPHMHPYQRSSFSDGDEYAGLMTQREKEWLVRIQMLQLHTDNPYVDDYYHTTYIMRKMIREKRKADGKGNDVKLVLPDMGRPESKAYVPIQFENSLGKLQAISVNFPRRVLEMDVQLAGAEEDNRLPANKELHRQRRLLLDIEKLYSVLLDIDDEQKRMFALPDHVHGPHREKREGMIDVLFDSLGCSNPRNPEEKLSQMALIRKGRHLLFRAMILFSLARQVALLSCMLRSIGSIVRKDVNDRILVLYLPEVVDIIDRCTFADLVLLGQGLKSGAPLEQYNGGVVSPSRERGNYIAALHNQFGVSVICSLFHRADHFYSDPSSLKNDLENEWKQIVHHLVDTICSVPVFSFHSSVTSDLLGHLDRFSVDDEKKDILREKLEPVCAAP